MEAGVRITERDLQILRAINGSLEMTSKGIAVTIFEGRASAAKKRIRTLRLAGLIAPIGPTGPRAAALRVTDLGRELERNGFERTIPVKGMAPKRASSEHDRTVRQLGEIMQSRCRNSGLCSVDEYWLEPKFCRFGVISKGGRKKITNPDAFASVRRLAPRSDPSDSFFLEFDRGTESLDIVVEKVRQYVRYFRTGGFAAWRGAGSRDYKRHPFRVLFVVRSSERRNNLAEQILIRHPSILTQLWIATLSEFLADPFGAIWTRPMDYRSALSSRLGHSMKLPYGRSSLREKTIEQALRKVSLFGPSTPPTLARDAHLEAYASLSVFHRNGGVYSQGGRVRASYNGIGST